MPNLPDHILMEFADQARGLLARVEQDLAEMCRATEEVVASDAAERATGAIRSIRTGATFLELGELAGIAQAVERRLENMRVSGGAVDDSMLEMLRAAVAGLGQSTAAPAIQEPPSDVAPDPQGDGNAPTTRVAALGDGQPTTEPLRILPRKAVMLGDLLDDLAAAHSRLEGLALGSIAGAVDEAGAQAIETEGRAIRRLGRFFGVDALEAIGAAVECAAPAMRRSDDAARRAVPRLRAVLHAFVEFTHALGTSCVVRRDLTHTCTALARIGAGDGESVADVDEGASWTVVLDADAGRPVHAGQTHERESDDLAASESPVIDPSAALAASRVEAGIAPNAKRPAGATDALLSPLANVMTQAARVTGMAGSIPEEGTDPVDAVRAVNRVADDLRRAAEAMKGTVMASRRRVLDTLLSECATMVLNIAAQSGRDLRADVRGPRLELDEAVMDRLHDPLLAVVRRIAMAAARAPGFAQNDGNASIVWLAAETEGSHLCIRVGVSGAPEPCPPASTAEASAARDSIEAMAGSLETAPDVADGAAAIVRVPMNLAFIDAMVVRIGEMTCAIPTTQVEEIVMPGAGQVASMGGHRTVQLSRATVPLVDGRAALGSGSPGEPQRLAVVVRAAGRRVAIGVDRAIGRQEVVVRPTDPTVLGAGPIWSGASIADGSNAVVLDVPALVRSTAADFAASAAA